MKKGVFLSALLCLALSHSQDSHTYMLQTPGDAWLGAPINPVLGTFSAFSLRETDPDFSSLLFSGPAMNSRIAFTIDQKPYEQSNLKALVPMGPTVGYQVDGVFQSPEGLHLETAYFLMGADLSGELKTLGVAVLASNTSAQPRRLGVKILLDTEIGEAKSRPLLYLPSGAPLDRPYRFSRSNIPSYIFAGERLSTASTAEGKGFYIYPYLSTNFPSMVVVENWGRLSSSPWIPEALGRDFSFGQKSLPDGGVGLYFGEYTLAPGEEITLGAGLSLVKIVTVPVLKDDETTRSILTETALSRGVFAPERYLVNEILVNPGNAIVQEFLAQKNLPQIERGRGLTAPLATNTNTSFDWQEDINIFNPPRSPYARDILRMNYEMEYLQRLYDQNMGFAVEPPASSRPPYGGSSSFNPAGQGPLGSPPYGGVSNRNYHW